MSVVFSSCCIPLFYQIVKKIFDSQTALLGALFLSLSPIFLAVSIYGMSHAPALFFLLLGIFFLLSFRDNRDNKMLAWAGISTGLLGGARIQDMILMSIPLTLLLSAVSSRMPLKFRVKNFCIFWFMAALFSLLLHLPYAINKDSSHYFSQLKNFWQMGTHEYFYPFCHECHLAILNYFFLNSELSGLLLALLGLGLFLAAKNQFSLFYLLWILCPLLYYGNVVTLVPRYLLILLPPLCIAQGYLLNRLLTKNIWFKIFSITIFLITISLPLNRIYPTLLLRHQYALLPDYARWINEITEKRSIIICADECGFIEYYGHRPIMNKVDSNQFPKYKEKLDDLLREGYSIYATPGGLFAYDSKRNFSNFLLNNYEIIIAGRHPYEDWHQGCLKQRVYSSRLFQIKPRSL